MCKRCYDRDAYATNPGRVLARNKVWRDTNREATNARVREKYPTVAEERRANCKQWGVKYPERKRAGTKAWEAANPEAHRAIQGNYRARRRNAKGRHTAGELRALFDRCRHVCQKCLASGGACNPLSVDHIIPLALGGTDYAWNLNVLCRKCNSGKNDTVQLWIDGELVYSDEDAEKPQAVSDPGL